MYDYNYGYVDYGYADYEIASNLLGGIIAIFGVVIIISLVIGIITLVSLWKIYKKAGKNGWEAIVPVYSIIVLLQITELPMWYLVLFIIPIANIYAIFKIYIELAHKFGKSTGFGVATVFFSFICLPMLAFSKNTVYSGENNPNRQTTPTEVNPVNFNNANIDQNVSNSSETISFSQNINTQINPIPQTENTNNNEQINQFPQSTQEQPITFNATQTINPTPTLNIIPETNTGSSEVIQNNSEMQSQPQQGLNVIPGNNEPQQVTPNTNLTSSQKKEVTPTPESKPPVETIIPNPEPTLNVIPETNAGTPEVNKNNSEMQNQPQQELNVMPNQVSNTFAPEQNNNNNQNI